MFKKYWILMSTKLRRLNRPGENFLLKLWSNQLLINFFDLHFWNLNPIAWRNWFIALRIWSNHSRSIKKDPKYSLFIKKIFEFKLKSIDFNQKRQNQSKKLMDFAIYDGFWPKFKCFWCCNWHLGRHFWYFYRKLVEINWF